MVSARRPETYTTWGFGYPSSSEYPPIAPSPSTGQTTLVTPTSANGKIKRGWFGRLDTVDTSSPKSKSSKKSSSTKGQKDTRPPAVLRPESQEMIMVTYEEGLAKLGLGRPHHILYPESVGQDEPPAFEETRQAYPSISPRAVPGRSGLRTAERDGGSEERRDRVTSAERVREWARSPLNRTPGTANSQDSGVTRPGVAGIGAGHQHQHGTRGVGGQAGKETHQNTWLPSYYHTPERSQPRLPEESELDYRAGAGTGVSPGRDQWSGNRI